MNFSPAPKITRIVDPQAIWFVVHKRDGICMIGLDRPGKYGPCLPSVQHCHHIDNRGAGGDDVLENLIDLCPVHHDMAQAHKIPKEELRDILTKRYGYQYA
jgi:hypothetical protein